MPIKLLQNLPSLKFLVNESKETFKRFPYVVVISLLTVIYSICMVEWDMQLEDGSLVFTLALGIPLFLASTLLRESRDWMTSRHRIIELIAGALFLSAYHWLTANDTTNNYFLKYAQMSLALHLLVSFVGFIQNHDENKFWQFNRYIFLRILLSGLYATVLYIGLVIALVTINKLFSIKINSDLYGELWLFCALGFQTWHFLSGVPRLNSLQDDRTYPKGLRLFVQFLLIPMVSLYTIILYCYMAKILITQNWPSGNIGWLVSVMSVLGIFNLLLINPEKDRTESKWIAAYSKYYYILILPLLAMLFVAIGKRISEYGVTEQRYFLLVLGALLTGISIYFIFSTKKNIKVIPVSLFALALITLFGPWGAYDFSLRNQKNRAQAILERNSLLAGDTATPALKQEISRQDMKDLSSIFDYIIRNHGSENIAHWFPAKTIDEIAHSGYSYRGGAPRANTQNSKAAIGYLGLKYITKWDSEESTTTTYFYESDMDSELYEIRGYEQAMNFAFTEPRSGTTSATQIGFVFKGRNVSLNIDKKKSVFTILMDKKEVMSISMVKMLKDIKASDAGTFRTNIKNQSLALEANAAALGVKVLISSVSTEYDKDEPTITSVHGLLLLKAP